MSAAVPVVEQARGIWCPLLTPIDRELAPDTTRLVAHARWVMVEGCHGLVLFGTTGEAASFSVEERIAVLEAVLAAGLPADRILVGTGCCALADSLRLTRHAVSLGVAGVLMLPPFFFKGVSDEGLFASYDRIIQGVDDGFGLYLYHFPRLSGVPITSPLIERLLTAHPGIVRGVKDSSGDWVSTKGLIERFPGLAIFPGAETLLLPALQAGGAGCISASCNVNARAIRRLYDTATGGAGEIAPQQERLAALRRLLETWPQISAMKELLCEQQGEPAWRRVRPPLLPLAAAEAAALAAAAAELGFVPGRA
jgi:4-hydroxy-tetrahydrodipicolinate synthase